MPRETIASVKREHAKKWRERNEADREAMKALNQMHADEVRKLDGLHDNAWRMLREQRERHALETVELKAVARESTDTINALRRANDQLMAESNQRFEECRALQARLTEASRIIGELGKRSEA